MTKEQMRVKLQAEIDVLEHLCNTQARELEALRLELSIAQRNAPRGAHQLPAHFATAREAAMRLRCVVKAWPMLSI